MNEDENLPYSRTLKRDTILFFYLYIRAVPDSGFSNPAGATFGRICIAVSGRSRMFINLLCDLCHVSTYRSGKHLVLER